MKKLLFFRVISIILLMFFLSCQTPTSEKKDDKKDDDKDEKIIPNLSGLYDTSFNTGKSGSSNQVNVITVQSDGKILIGGSFTIYNGTNVPDYIIRLNADGTVDNTFNNGGTGASGGYVYSIAVQTDGKILISGYFTHYNGVDVPDYIIRLNTDGTWDDSFNLGGTGASSSVNEIAIQSDGKIIIGGQFTTYNGENCPDRIIRLNADGTWDDSFNNEGAGFGDVVSSMVLQSDGKILIGFTNFSSYNEYSTQGIMRINADGTFDTSFNPGGTGTNFEVGSIAVQSDGKILIGGGYTTYNDVDVPDRIIRLNTDGSWDDSFNNIDLGANDFVDSIAVQLDGKILIGGWFTTYNDIDVPDYIIRLNADGKVDNSFNNGGSGANGYINSIKIQSDGKILIGGIFQFTTYNGEDVPDRIIRLYK